MTVKTIMPPTEIDKLRRQAVFTTGEIARLLHISARSISKWFDSGRLRGYRMPGSQDRRIPRESLIKFLKENGMSTDAVVEPPTALLLVGLEPMLASAITEALPTDCKCHAAATAFAAGLLVRDLAPAVVVIDLAAGRADGIGMAKAIRQHAECADAMLIAVANEDEADTPELIQAGFTEVFQRPFDVALLAECVRMAEV